MLSGVGTTYNEVGSQVRDVDVGQQETWRSVEVECAALGRSGEWRTQGRTSSVVSNHWSAISAC